MDTHSPNASMWYMRPAVYVYDIESFPNLFTCVIYHPYSNQRWIFEVSERCNDTSAFYWFIRSLEQNDCIMVGYNNQGYDYQVIHHCMMVGEHFTAMDAYKKTDFIINTGTRDEKFKATVWPQQHLVRQVDLFQIHHFDRNYTSLKELEFNMRARNISESSAEFGKPVPLHLIDEVISYNCDDVAETLSFLTYSEDKIVFREELSEQTGIDMTNFNDTKIGKKYFEAEIEKVLPGACKLQTHRASINLAACVFPWISFDDPSLSRVLEYIKNQVIEETKSPPEFKDLSATVKGFQFDFGAGGMHGSVPRQKVTPEPNETLIDVDVTSFYPALGIVNRVYPQHLTEVFCDVYKSLFDERRTHPKKTAPNEMLKLALNGVYGQTNEKFSSFYDPQYTMTITLNGQLLLCLLAEKLLLYTTCRLVQANTDGLTVIVPNDAKAYFDQWCEWWQKFTCLELEFAEYKHMWIRDVNNYIAETIDGKLKRIGAYAYETQRENPATREVRWHKNHSSLVVQKAAEAQMVHGVSVDWFIRAHSDPFDFMLKGKVTGGSWLELEDGTRLQKVTRYIISKTGQELKKSMPPLARKVREGKTERRIISINKGWNVHICDNIDDFDWSLIDYRWYIDEAKKLVI